MVRATKATRGNLCPTAAATTCPNRAKDQQWNSVLQNEVEVNSNIALQFLIDFDNGHSPSELMIKQLCMTCCACGGGRPRVEVAFGEQAKLADRRLVAAEDRVPDSQARWFEDNFPHIGERRNTT
eukprot:3871918-Amphidinium_carterae.3